MPCHPSGISGLVKQAQTRPRMKLKCDLKVGSSSLPGILGAHVPLDDMPAVTLITVPPHFHPKAPTVSSCLREIPDPSALMPPLRSWVLQDGQQTKKGGASHEYGGNHLTYWDLKLE